jgi:transposase
MRTPRLERINHALVMADRERVGREASPLAAIIDSQSVKTTEAGEPRGFDAGKKIKGRKRHALVDTDGRGLVLEPHPASIQDRDGGGPLLGASRRIFPFIQRVFADSGYAGEKVANATFDRGRGRAQEPRSGRLRCQPAALGRRAVLRMDWAQSTAGKGLRGHRRLRAPSSTSHPSCCSRVGSLVLRDFRNRL